MKKNPIIYQIIFSLNILKHIGYLKHNNSTIQHKNSNIINLFSSSDVFQPDMKCIQNSKLFCLLILIMGESGYLLIPKFAFTCRKILYYNISVSSA